MYFSSLFKLLLNCTTKSLSVFPGIVTSLSILGTAYYKYMSLSMSFSHTHLCSPVCTMEPRGLIARRVTEVAQSTLDMVSTAVDYPLCECTSICCQLCSSWSQIFSRSNSRMCFTNMIAVTNFSAHKCNLADLFT